MRPFVSEAINWMLAALLAVTLVVSGITLGLFLNALCAALRPHAVGATLTHVTALMIGAWFGWVVALARRRRELPPATARQITRAARANRLRQPARWSPPARADFNFDDGPTR